jgi:hypothetical protein
MIFCACSLVTLDDPICAINQMYNSRQVGGGGGVGGRAIKVVGADSKNLNIFFFLIISCASVVLTLNIPIHGIIHKYNSTVPTSHPTGGGV